MPTLPFHQSTLTSDSRESETCLFPASVESSISDHLMEQSVLERKQGDLESNPDHLRDECDWSPSIGDLSRFYSCMWTA